MRTYAKAFTFAALLILGTGAAASAAPSPKAQLDVMARSPVIQEEINTMYHRWDLILKSSNADRSMYRFYAVVTDLDRNGRLELLISNQYINKDPLFYAGEDISKEQRRGLTSLSNIFPGRIRGAAYEISADGTALEPLEIQCGSAAFPDFTRIYLKPHKADAHPPPYYVDTILMPRDLTMTKGRDCYPIVREAQHIRLDAGVLTVSTIARLEGLTEMKEYLALCLSGVPTIPERKRSCARASARNSSKSSPLSMPPSTGSRTSATTCSVVERPTSATSSPRMRKRRLRLLRRADES